MIKLIIFDLDGVLVDTEELHYSALLNAIRELTALSDLEITQHIKKDGRSTAEKLKTLQTHFKINNTILTKIDKLKQLHSVKMLKNIKTSEDINKTIIELHKKYTLALVSNSRISNVSMILNNSNINYLFSSIVTPDTSILPKPAPDMFTYVMRKHRVLSTETLILEDSPSGIEAGLRSEAYVMSINSLVDTNLTNITYVINQITDYNCSDGGKRKQIFSCGIS